MSELSGELKNTFREECIHRMLSAKQMLQQCNTTCDQALCYDRIHQEFDTLYGGARAINVFQPELFTRSFAMYARYLRNKLPEKATNEETTLLAKGIEYMLMACDTEYPEYANSDNEAEIILTALTHLTGIKAEVG